MQKQLGLSVLSVLMLMLSGCRSSDSCIEIEQLNSITIGVASGYAPWATRNEANELEGFDVDIATELAHQLEIPLTIVDMSPEMLMASVRAGKIDCMVAPMAITPEREKAFNMVHYQGTAARQWPVMMLHDASIDFTDLKQLRLQGRYTIGALSGTKQSEYALEIEGITAHLYDTMAHILMALRARKIDYALIDPDLGQQLLHEHPDMRYLLIKVPELYQSVGNGIAIHKSNNDLTRRIQTAIEVMKEKGIIAAAENRWGIGRLS